MIGNLLHHFRAMVLLLMIVFPVWTMMSSSSREGQGIWIVAHSLTLLTFAALLFRKLLRSDLRFVCLSLMLWSGADLGWAANYFFFANSARTAIAVLTTELLYVSSFLIFAWAIIRNVGTPTAEWFDRVVVAVPLVMATPIAAQFIFSPILFSEFGSAPAFALSESLAILSSYGLLVLALYVFVCSQCVGWTFLSSGLVCIVFADWAMRAPKILANQTSFGVASLLMLFGLYSVCVTLLLQLRSISALPSFDESSLLVRAKMTSLILLFSSVVIYCVIDPDSVHAVPLICFAGAIGTLVSGWSIHWYAARLENKATSSPTSF